MMKIEQIWSELENDKSLSHGLLLKRYSADLLPDIFIALKLPEGFRCIVASLSNINSLNFGTYHNFKDINVEVIPDNNYPEKNYLIFELLSAECRDIFSVLCEDLISGVTILNEQGKILKELINRFEKWQSLFDKVSSPGLRPEEQRGLFGELYLLKKLLLSFNQTRDIISSWIGSEKQIRDFQYFNWAIEVKTTHGNNHQKIQINSERQLDISNLDNLFLFHLSLESHLNSGETLDSIIDSIRLLLKDDYVSLNKFNYKLIEAGYINNHNINYSDTGYFIRNETYYKVEKDFPRIEEKDIRNGVGDVQYSIIIAQFTEYLKSEEFVFLNVVFQ